MRWMGIGRECIGAGKTGKTETQRSPSNTQRKDAGTCRKGAFPQIDTSNEDGLYTPLTMTRVCNRKRIGSFFGNARQRRKQEETRSKKYTV
jgi:hypothetical protein